MVLPLMHRDIHHFGLVVDDIDEAAAHVESTYGLTMKVFEPFTFACRYLGRDIDIPTQTAVSVSGPPYLELVQSVPDTHLTTVPGIHHVAYTVEDLIIAAEALEARGLERIMGCIVDGEYPALATYHRDPLGPVIELLTLAGAQGMMDQLAAAIAADDTSD